MASFLNGKVKAQISARAENSSAKRPQNNARL